MGRSSFGGSMQHHNPADGWKVYGPGGMYCCPACDLPLGAIGTEHRVYLRVHPAREKTAKPTPGVPMSERCKHCRVNLERDPVRAMAVA
jgi:hypothetical protein